MIKALRSVIKLVHIPLEVMLTCAGTRLIRCPFVTSRR